MDFRQKADEVLQATAEAIDRPGHYNIEFAAGSGLMQGIECWPLVLALGAADAVVLVDVDDIPTSSLGDLPQLALLICRCLILR